MPVLMYTFPTTWSFRRFFCRSIDFLFALRS